MLHREENNHHLRLDGRPHRPWHAPKQITVGCYFGFVRLHLGCSSCARTTQKEARAARHAHNHLARVRSDAHALFYLSMAHLFMDHPDVQVKLRTRGARTLAIRLCYYFWCGPLPVGSVFCSYYCCAGDLLKRRDDIPEDRGKARVAVTIRSHSCGKAFRMWL